eukprot:gb/GFBE01041541.1/.p1 GENE.gb/GFBE01041541.1/~~gb/GFBE01041541.1/.p1  ORF type:complete len:322 (+),score=60.68 gb/GFBE01041541.1/:1-966(+)
MTQRSFTCECKCQPCDLCEPCKPKDSMISTETAAPLPLLSAAAQMQGGKLPSGLQGNFKQIAFYNVNELFPQFHIFQANSKDNFDHLGEHLERHSQWSQDWHAATYNGCKRNGFFLDLAANLAVKNSNTLMLERDFGWKGILFEANPKFWWGLLHRNNSAFLGAVGATDQHVTFNLREETSGIVGDNFDNKKPSGSAVLSYTTVALADVLRLFGAPSRIDYFSLDVEGAESYIMTDFPWGEYTFNVLNVERPKPDLKKWLADAGYVLLRENPSWDQTYVHRTLPDFAEIKAKWTGEGNVDLPHSCMDDLGYQRPENKKWPR